MQRIRRCWGTAMLMFMSLAVTGLMTANVVVDAGASPGNACELLTLKDVQSILGSGFVSRQDIPLAGQTPTMSNCAYGESANDSKGNGVVISLQRIVMDSAQYLKMEQTGIKQQGGGVTVTAVGGLGDGAFYFLGASAQKNPGQFQLHFGKGTRLVIIAVVTGGKPNIAAAQKLAKIAYSSLK